MTLSEQGVSIETKACSYIPVVEFKSEWALKHNVVMLQFVTTRIWRNL